MEEYLIAYLIDEGYANTESSAYKILDVISEGFYEYLLNEAETAAQQTARRRKEITRTFTNADRRAAVQTRRQQNKAVDPYQSTSGAQKDRPNPRGGELPTLGQRGRTATANQILARAGQNPNKPHAKVTTGRGSSLISQSDFSTTTTTFKGVKPGQKSSQVFNPNISSTIDVGAKVGGTPSQRYSRDESDNLSRRDSSPTEKKKPQQQTTQPPESASGNPVRRRVLPSEATRSTSQRPTSPRRNPSRTEANVTQRQLRTGTNRIQRVVGIQPKKP
jgi:hypothetical protein